ncbi:MAG: OsmC family protein [Porticoccaceae bacterium]|nr:OsmC family protein [Porticoccaceae bacterium]
MLNLPHHYSIKVNGAPTGDLIASADHLPYLEVSPPLEFGGPGDKWSPEDLLMAAVANCLVLSFRMIAATSKLEWKAIECISEGELNQMDGKMLFTKILSRVRLVILSEDDRGKAEKLLQKAEEACLISNSLSAELTMDSVIEIEKI